MKEQAATLPEESRLITKYQKKIIVLLALLQFTIILDFVIISPLSDIMMKTMSISTSQFGLIVSSYAFSAGLSGILTAGFADKFDRKKLLLVFYSGFTLGTLCCALAGNYHALVAARIVTGLFGGVIGSISLSIVTDLFALKQRGRVMGVIQMAFAASQILGVPMGIFIANQWNWHITFVAIVVLCVFIIAGVVFIMAPVTEHLKLAKTNNALLHLWNTLRRKRYRVGFMATAFLAVGGYMMMPFSSAYMVNNLKITQQQLPWVFMCTGIASIIVMPLVGRLSDRFNKFKIFTTGSIVAIIMVTLFTKMPASPLWVVIMVNMLLFVGIMSRSVPASTLNTAIPDASDRGAFMAITSSLQQMSGGVAAIFAGYIVYQPSQNSPLQHFDTLGFVVSAIVLLCIFFIKRVDIMLKANN